MDMTTYFNPGLFDGKKVLITGGATGIGYLAAQGFAQLGAHVIVASRTANRLAEAVDTLVGQGYAASWYPVNVRDDESVRSLVARVVEDHGRIDVLFNNAGGQFAVMEERLSPNGWRAVIDLNLNSTFYCCSEVGKVMIEQGGGKIITMATSFPDRASPGIVHRGAAAAGVVQMTQTLALAWAEHGIQVNAIGPQYLTEGAKQHYRPEIEQHFVDITPMHRWGRAYEIAGSVLFLASPMADYITGTLLRVDGGCHLGVGVNYRGTSVLPEDES